MQRQRLPSKSAALRDILDRFAAQTDVNVVSSDELCEDRASSTRAGRAELLATMGTLARDGGAHVVAVPEAKPAKIDKEPEIDLDDGTWQNGLSER